MNTTQQNNNTPTANSACQSAAPIGRYRPSLSFYHANAKGTGCAMKMELHPAHDDTDGSIMMKAACQKTIGNRCGPTPTYATFDWENQITVKLDFADLSKILQVLRGECESLEDGKGLLHRTREHMTRIVLRHLVDPMQCYSLDLYRTMSANSGAQGTERHAHIVFNMWEALGLCESISGSMSIISFGIPMLVPHDTSAYVAGLRRSRNESAA